MSLSKTELKLDICYPFVFLSMCKFKKISEFGGWKKRVFFQPKQQKVSVADKALE